MISSRVKREVRDTIPAGRHSRLFAGLAITLFTALCSCQSKTNSEESMNHNHDATSQNQADPINPNGTSELAALMRQLADFAESNQRHLKNNEKPEPWPEDVNRLLTAKATDAEIKGPHYDAFAHDFIAATRRFNETADNTSESRLRHNAIVGACVSCHEQACAGPLGRIKKLYLN